MLETCTFSKKFIAIFSVKCDNLFPSPLIRMVRQFRALAGMRKEIFALQITQHSYIKTIVVCLHPGM